MNNFLESYNLSHISYEDSVKEKYLTQMSRPRLDNYIKKLEICIAIEQDPKNLKIYRDWLADAKFEVEARNQRRLEYLRRKEKRHY